MAGDERWRGTVGLMGEDGEGSASMVWSLGGCQSWETSTAMDSG